MSVSDKAWDGELVRNWLARRLEYAKLDQSVADRRGYEARDEYDMAAAEEWVCRKLLGSADIREQVSFARRLKELIGQEDYPTTGVNDDARFQRHVRGQLRKVAKMTKANEGFEKPLRYQ